ncbi:zinc-binding dehydrogenase [Streptomyces sp. HUAS TT20]|uniref:zinc-binding dehydrogenase n=1 Tax=Streptomyces sp. HUAS TT20 TaxID=3447509 RepID=UPI0021D98BD5|nr:zinc-binding dehydrogenase [Streptomyces sp. HUAS 15-9]UXY32317.1 zinc-binding dehydrogenase [Streptomyces sp. HUAS 15-9]
MRRVVVDHFGGPEVLRVVEDDDPRPGRGEVCVRVLAAGVSFTDALLRAGSYLGVPKPPFTPGYELVGVGEELPVGRRRALPVGGGPRYPDWFREDFHALLQLLRRGEIHPVVAERLPLSDARRAHELLERSAATGKIVLVPQSEDAAR